MRTLGMLLGLLAISNTLVGQSIAVGYKAGLTTTYQVGWCCGEPNPFSSRTGITTGVTGSLQVRGPLAVQAELIYSGKGIQGFDVFKMRLNYLEFPLLLRLAPTSRNTLRPVMLVGVAPAVELSCSGSTRPPSIPEHPAPIGPLDCGAYRTTKADLSVIGALGADLRMGAITWTFEGRYSRGVRDLTPQWHNTHTYNRAAALLVGIRIGRP